MKINILGLGTMGRQLASLFYLGGYDIIVWDEYKPEQEGVYREIKLLKKYIKSDLVGTITFVNSIEELGNNLTIESVIEDLEVKKGLFRILKTRISRPYFTNTSSYTPLEIGRGVNGLHFFNPVTLKIIELYLIDDPKNKDIEEILRYLKSLDFQVIEVHGNRGYIANYLLFHEISSVLKLIEVFKYPEESVDKVYKKLYNGRDIFNIIDIIGIDVVYRVMVNLKESYETIYLAKCLKDCIDKNILGKKNKTSIRDILNNQI